MVFQSLSAANMAATNINMICYCEARVKRLWQNGSNWLPCQSCFRPFDANHYYGCAAQNCTFRSLSGASYTLCAQCANAINPDDLKSDDGVSGTSIMSKKMTLALKQIS